MLTRFGIGLLKGLVIGGLILAALLFGVGWASVPVWAGYLLAVVVGAFTGLVAGKPIWQQDARIEAGLKSAAGAILAPLILLALRQWVPVPLLAKGHSVVGEVSVVAFPLITMVLGLFYELDNTPAPEKAEEASSKGKPGAAGKVRVSGEVASTEELDESLELPPPSQQAKQRNGRR